jgi:filamentous hemagglutinin
MLMTNVLSAEKKLGRSASRWAGMIVTLLVVFGFSTPTALGQCTLTGTVTTWSAAGANGLWNNGPSWNGGVPNATTSACIGNGSSGSPTVVTQETPNGTYNYNVLNLQLGSSYDTLNINGNVSGNGVVYVYGTQIINAGTINLNSGSSYNQALIMENNVTLSGAGTISLNPSGISNEAYLENTLGAYTLTNQNNTIQGEGYIINDYTGGSMVNQSLGIINANVASGTIYFDNNNATLTNQGLLEATTGGQLELFSSTINNNGGNITANGSGSTVELVYSTIRGGTLNTLNGGTMTSVDSNILDGSTANGAVTLSAGSTFLTAGGNQTALLGTIVNYGNFQVNSSDLYLNGNTTLDAQPGSPSPGGTVTLSTPVGTSSATITVSTSTLTNDDTIQGDGVITGGNSPGITNSSTGIINANSTGCAGACTTILEIEDAHNLTNSGLMEATNSGNLLLYANTINNAGGNITANGSGAIVDIMDTTIQGGTLNTLNGGTMVSATDGYGETRLDGSPAYGAVTISSGSTFEIDGVAETGVHGPGIYGSAWMLGTINNQGTILLNSTGLPGSLVGGTLYTGGNTTLEGGGTITLTTPTGSSNSNISQGGAYTLDNVNNTIQGQGMIQNAPGSLINEANGKIIANTGVGLATTLEISGGTVTNNGTLQVNPGATLELYNYNSFTNFTTNGDAVSNPNYVGTLAGGNYVVNSGTLEIYDLGYYGREITALGNGVAPTSLTLNGASALVTDGSIVIGPSYTALSALALSSISANASLTIENGNNLSTPGNLSNSGSLKVGALTGAHSTLTVGSGATNTLTNYTGGMISGSGTIVGNVVNAGGTVSASDPGTPDTLTINGNYTQTSGILEAFLGGTTLDPIYSHLAVTGTAALDGGTLDLDLVPGSSVVITPGESFDLLTATEGITGSLNVVGLPPLPGNDTWSISFTGGTIEVMLTGSEDYSLPHGVPEPSTYLLLLLGIAALAFLRKHPTPVRSSVDPK